MKNYLLHQIVLKFKDFILPPSPMNKYNDFVFDVNARTFKGDFQGMYLAEKEYGFDSWHQEDLSLMNRRIAFALLDPYEFKHILDLGSGKGLLTSKLKTPSNIICGVDISEAAVSIASERFPEIDFYTLDLNNIEEYTSFFDAKILPQWKTCELIFAAECLSYLSHWRQIIVESALRTKYILITLYIPDNPIGFVKSFDELEQAVSDSFRILETVICRTSRFIVIFAKSS